LHLRFVSHIRQMGCNPQALRQLFSHAQPLGFSHRLCGDIAHRQIAAFGNELTDKLSSHAGAATGDNRYPASEILHDVPPDVCS
jgi:hypothetical protein